MTAVAKVCAAMVTTGLAYGIGRAAIEAIIKGKGKEDSGKAALRLADKIILRNNFRNMIRTNIFKKLGSSFVKKSFISGGLIGTGVTSAYASPMTVGLSSAASVLGVVAPIVIAGAIIVTGVVLCVKYKDKIKDFIDSHPVVEKIVNGVKTVGKVIVGVAVAAVALPVAAVCWVGKKIWEGIKSFGSWLGGLFGI